MPLQGAGYLPSRFPFHPNYEGNFESENTGPDDEFIDLQTEVHSENITLGASGLGKMVIRISSNINRQMIPVIYVSGTLTLANSKCQITCAGFNGNDPVDPGRGADLGWWGGDGGYGGEVGIGTPADGFFPAVGDDCGIGGPSGNGGTAGAFTGGAGGFPWLDGDRYLRFPHPLLIDSLCAFDCGDFFASSPDDRPHFRKPLTGGLGGGGGGGSGGVYGGGGGGIVKIVARRIDISGGGIISASGGHGAHAISGESGGGGGGSGGLVILEYGELITGTGKILASGGNGGRGFLGGGDGDPGGGGIILHRSDFGNKLELGLDGLIASLAP